MRGKLKQEMEQSYNDSFKSEKGLPEKVNELEHLSLSGIKGQIVVGSLSISDQFLEYMTQSYFENAVEEFDFEGNEEL